MEKADIWIIVGALALVLALLLGVFGRQAVATGSWGLSFSTGEPVGPESGQTLSPYNAHFRDGRGEQVIYLTFDAGYENGCTAEILDVLKKHQAPAAFFLTGHYLDSSPELVQRMADEGHTVGNHTLSHPDMSRLGTQEFAAQLTGLEEKYRALTGQELPGFYRPPQGVYSHENLRQAKELGYTTVFWSLAYADWDNQNQPDPDKAVALLTERIHPGAIVLLHSTSQTNAAILDRLLTAWEEMGYRFAPLTELGS